MRINYMDFSDRSHWNGNGVGGEHETRKQRERDRLKRNVSMIKRIKEKTFDEYVTDAIEEVKKEDTEK